MIPILDRQGGAFIATSAFLAATFSNIGAVPLGILGIVAGISSIQARGEPQVRRLSWPCAAMTGVLMFGGLQSGLINLPYEDRLAWWIWVVLGSSLTVLCAANTRRRGIGLMILSLALIGSFAIGWRLVESAADSPAQADVLLFHQSAASSIANSLNPYKYATAPNTDPNLPSPSIIRGYSYPPVTMAGPALMGVLTNEPRWAHLAAWMVFLGSLGMVSLRLGGALTPLISLFAVWPLYRETLFVAWTEPISIALVALVPTIAGASSTRVRQAVASTCFVAAAVSKQYFAFLLPLIGSCRLLGKRSLLIAISVAGAATLLPYALLGPADLANALYSNLAAIGKRPDSYSISGLLASLGLESWALPPTLWLGLIAVFGLVLGRKVRTGPEILIGGACVLAFGFLIGVAFVNYWLLCASLVAIAAVWDQAYVLRSPSRLASDQAG